MISRSIKYQLSPSFLHHHQEYKSWRMSRACEHIQKNSLSSIHFFAFLHFPTSSIHVVLYDCIHFNWVAQTLHGCVRFQQLSVINFLFNLCNDMHERERVNMMMQIICKKILNLSFIFRLLKDFNEDTWNLPGQIGMIIN